MDDDTTKSLKLKKVVHDGDDSTDKDNQSLDLSLEKLSLGPKKKLLVLSLNGLVIHRVYSPGNTTILPGSRRPDGRYGTRIVYKRPFCDQFMKFCLDRFDIGVWSSVMEHNADGILNCVLKGLKDKLLFVWDQRQCTDTGFMSLENNDKPIYLKELKKLWENEDNKLPWQKGKYSSSNTLMIDDKPYKALLNPSNTAIFPESYNVDDKNDNALDPKGEFGQFLDGLAEAEDVQAYVEKHPFGQPAVTPVHSDWLYYAKIILHRRKEKGVASKST